MVNKSFNLLLECLLVILMCTLSLAQDRTIGVLYSDTSKMSEGYTLFAPKHYTSTYLIDNQGRVINSWESSTYEPGQSVYLLKDGSLLRTCFNKQSNSTGGGEGGRIEGYDWDDNLIWEFDYSTTNYVSHHDIEPLPNGNILVLAVEKKTYNECVAAGFNPNYLQDVLSRGYMLPDYIIEIEPTLPEGANIVWEWHVWDHLVQDYDTTKENYGNPASHPELVDVNGTNKQLSYFWNHMNSIDYNAEFDQIMMSVRGNSELWVIDHSTTTEEAAGHSGGTYGKGGDLLFRWGNPSTYSRGDRNDQMLFEQHDCQWVEPGKPGEGNILVFNNGLSRLDGSNYSSVDEIVPPVDSSGFYILAAGSAFEPHELLWTYTAPNKTDMYAEAISGAQRLWNGNTLICDGTHGTFLEVTPVKELVWEYNCPVDNNGPMTQGEEPGLDVRQHQYNAVFKIQRYPTDYTAFDGKDMTPSDVIELGVTGIKDGTEIPSSFQLYQNYPNPFNPSTQIVVSIPESGNYTLRVFNILGQEVATLLNSKIVAGIHTFTFDASHLTSGIYLYIFRGNNFSQTKKMLLMK